MSNEKFGPNCGKCSKASVKRYSQTFEYWYCQACKDEVKEAPKVSGSLYVDPSVFIDNSALAPTAFVPSSRIAPGGWNIKTSGQASISPAGITIRCQHDKLTRDTFSGFWSCDDCGKVSQDPFDMNP